MRRITWIVAIVLCVTLVLSGCGKKDVEDVIGDLGRVLDNLESYEASGTMLLHTGQEPLNYGVEVWYKDPHYYRIALTNVKNDITQIVLRNDDGVFVLTPHLDKSFRFQSDWPDHQGQVYLYQTLAKSILMDQERLFTVDEDSDAYVFDVAANYDNSSLVRQKIWLKADDYAPDHVEIADENSNVMVVVEYEHFQFDKKFDEDSFEMDRNMTSWNMQSLEVMNETDAAMGELDVIEEELGLDLDEVDAQFGVLSPLYMPEGVIQTEILDITLGDEQAVLLRYEGLYNYSIVESWPQTETVSVLPGTIVDLQYTLGVLTGTDHKMLRWMYDGVEFRLTTDDLPQSEMIKIAQSVQGQIGK